MAVPPAPVRVPSQRPLTPSASITSVANDKGDNEMILGLCTDLLEFALQLRKTSASRPSMKVVLPVIPSNEVPYLKMRSVCMIAQHIRKGEGRKQGTGGYGEASAISRFL